MKEHDFSMQEERIKSEIRQQKIQQLTYDRESEKERTAQSRHAVDAEKQRTLQSKEDVGLEKLKLEGKRKDAVLLRHGITRKNLDANNANRENSLYGKTLDLKYKNLETGFDEAKKALENRRELLKERGLLT